MGGYSQPTAQEQLAFLAKIQRLLQDGQFTATYKFALLHAIADLCVAKGDDSGSPLVLTMRDITEQFVGLYDRQALPYPSRKGSAILKQNTSRQARVVTVLSERPRPYAARGPRGRPTEKVLSAINYTIRKQPLWKLQTLTDGDRLEFLYRNEDRTDVKEIRLNPGVAYGFRSFYGLIISLVRDRWERWIRRTNPDAVDERTNLQGFLFGSERRDLSDYRPALLEIQDGKCFYSGETFRSIGDVDHFIPWSLYPIDLGHNFVLAHKSSNAQKADALAAEDHLERWLQQCIDHRQRLEEGFDEHELPHDLRSSVQVVEWSYSMLERAEGRVWSKGKEFRKLSPRWRNLVDDAKRELFSPQQAG